VGKQHFAYLGRFRNHIFKTWGGCIFSSFFSTDALTPLLGGLIFAALAIGFSFDTLKDLALGREVVGKSSLSLDELEFEKLEDSEEDNFFSSSKLDSGVSPREITGLGLLGIVLADAKAVTFFFADLFFSAEALGSKVNYREVYHSFQREV